MPKQHGHFDRRWDALIGLLLGLGAPAGWLVFRFLATHGSLFLPWVKAEFLQFGALYAYMTVGTITVFTIFGYLLGRKNDGVTVKSDQVKDAYEHVSQIAITDALTNIHNARYLHDQVSIELESAKRYNTTLACLMIDIDDFKVINDTHGHPFGDVVLANIAKILRQSVRQIDIVGRLGGEEFLVVMPHTSVQMALPVAERIRQAVQRWPFPIDGKEVTVTVSIGVAAFPSEGIADKSSFLKMADDALYQAKRTGKNRTVAADIRSISAP